MTEAEWEKQKSRARGISNDMSPEAMSRRLDIVSELSDLCRWLATAQPVESGAKEQAE